jgi:uncharacterized protein with HEPN domain
MAPSRAPALRLRHIRDEIEAIRKATFELAFDAFRGTWVVRRAVEHGLLIISEATKSLPGTAKAAEPSIPWRQTEPLGNFLRHEYRDVDPDVLWRIVKDDLPTLEAAVERMLVELDREEGSHDPL